MEVATLRFEHRRETLGIGVARPRLSWTVRAEVPGWRQAAYELAVDGVRPPETTGRVASGESVLVAWPFAPLRSRERATVRVRVWGADGSASGWSAPAEVEAGLLDPADWTARFVGPTWPEDPTRPRPCPMLRREVELRGPAARARLYVTALGVYEARINGQRVGDHVLAPGWTSYRRRLRYQTFDVTPLLRAGRNAVGAILGDGWFRGRLGFRGGRRDVYGDRLALLAQLEVEYVDGSRETFATDDRWRAATGPIVASDLYDGETYDARLERDGWDQPGYDDAGWSPVAPVAWDLTTLVAPTGPPVRRTAEVHAVAVTRSPSGKPIVDFGQNLVGRARLTARGEAGQTVTLRHAEVLENGELCTRPLRLARATDQYTFRGGEAPETWEPRFTFHGFRYVEVDGWPGELGPGDVVAVVCHSDLERRGWFECSDPLLQRFHENVVWSMRGNFLDVPTDCPQRDERLGWTGDIEVFAPTATFLYDVAGFLESWLRDLAAEQDERGVVPYVVPNPLPNAYVPAAAWGDAATIVPSVLYERYGDLGVLAAQLPSMRAWVDCLANTAGARRLWDEGFQFGDWLDPAAPPDKPGAARTDPGLVATAYFARSAELLSRAAGLLGQADEAARYAELAAEVRAAFDREYASPNGRIVSDAQTAYALALQFGLIEGAARRAHAAARLVTLVRAEGHCVGTGFVGTPLILDALAAAGAWDDAFKLLMQRACPSWLYPVTMGATTIWERWDSLRPDGSVNPGQMTSFNHYALGAAADFLHRSVGGLAPAGPGYRRLRVAPRPGGGLTWARVEHVTPYGPAACRWRLDGDLIEVEVSVPPNTTAEIVLPGRDDGPVEVGAGAHRWRYVYAQERR